MGASRRLRASAGGPPPPSATRRGRARAVSRYGLRAVKLLYVSRFHTKAGDYAAAMEARGTPKTCGYRHRKDWGPCNGPVTGLQRDHVDELQDAPWQDPKKAWVIFACAHHHQCKTNEKRAERKARKEGRMAQTAPRLPNAPGGSKGGTTKAASKKKSGGGWRSHLATVVSLAVLALIAASYWFNITGPLSDALGTALAWLPLVLACAVLALAARYGPRMHRWLMRKRDEERSDWLLAKAAGIARKMQCAPDAVHIEPRGRGAWTREGLCVRGRVTYPDHVLDDDPKLRKTVEDHWRHKLGIPNLVIEWNVGRNWYDYRPLAAGSVAPVESEEEAPPPDQHAEHAETMDNLTASLRAQFKDPEITVEVVSRSTDHSPTALRIFYGTKFPDAKDTSRLDFLAAVQAKTDARWRPDWKKTRNILTLALRPQMPAFVPNPTVDPEHPAFYKTGSASRFPLGIGEHGEVLFWDIYDAPHALIAGGTGGGKTVTLHALIWWASIMGWDIVLVDPKGVGLGGLRNLPGVIRYALADPAEINATLVWTEQMMRERYRKVLDEGADYTDFRRVLVVVDEFADLVTLLRGWWKNTMNEKGDPAGLSSVVSIPRLGRECNVLEVIGIQQAAAGFFDGTEARDNFGLRLGLGPQSQQAAAMLFGRVDAGRDVPQEAKGRATYALKQGEPQEMQTFWTPTLLPNGHVKPRRQEDTAPHPDDVAAIARLRAVVDGLPRQRKPEYPDPAPEPPEPRRTRTRTRARVQTADPRTLRLSVASSQPRWVMLDDERVQVVAVDPDETADDHWLVTVVDEDGEKRDPVSFSGAYTFVLAEE